MQVTALSIPEVLLVEPRVFGDERGFFLETYSHERYERAGIRGVFVQDNWSRSVKGTIRGLHFQHPRSQGKLVSCARGAVYDVAVDVRRGSPTFGKWVGTELSEKNKRQLWLPPGFAHGFCVLSAEADFLYKCTDVYVPEQESAIAWNDPDIGIEWPEPSPVLSKRDMVASTLKQTTNLPEYHFAK